MLPVQRANVLEIEVNSEDVWTAPFDKLPGLNTVHLRYWHDEEAEPTMAMCQGQIEKVTGRGDIDWHPCDHRRWPTVLYCPTRREKGRRIHSWF